MDYSLPGSSVHRIFQASYWSGLPFPSPVDFPNTGIEPWSPALQVNSLLLSHWGSPRIICIWIHKHLFSGNLLEKRFLKLLERAMVAIIWIQKSKPPLPIIQEEWAILFYWIRWQSIDIVKPNELALVPKLILLGDH